MPTQAFHLSLNVANLEYSVGFYRLLFGCDPAKWFPDYAKFELADPALVLSLEPTKPTSGGTLNHLGLRVADRAAIDGFERRLKQVGVEVQRLTDIECCYSRQTKIVFRDPDANLIEVYFVEGEAARKAEPVAEQATAGAPISTGDASWEHLVGQPFPAALPAGPGSLGEVRLRGTFNRIEALREADRILAEAKTALREGGQLLLHLLVANGDLPYDLPALPPPADQVKHVPSEEGILRLVENAGFTHLEVKRLSHAPVMQLEGVELRELLLQAKKPQETGLGKKRDVVYKGPY